MPIRHMTPHAAVGPCALVASSRASRGVASSRVSGWGAIGGWSSGPSHTTYNPLLTSRSIPPTIGLTGLLNLLTVVTQLQEAQWAGVCGPQEDGAPCPTSP